MKLLHVASASLAAITLTLAVPASAGTVAPGFDDAGSLDPNDDNFTFAIATGLSLNFFGTTYTETYISNNGYFTFGSGQSAFTPTGLGSDYAGLPIIAAFFADVDTRGIGTLTYGSGSYAGRTAFGATWSSVGYYDARSDKTNSFQILLTDRSDVNAGDFDIYYNYDQIEWETGDVDGGTRGLGGTSAAVGFNAGNGNATGTYFEVPGSRVPGSFLDSGTAPLITATNDGTPGQLLFQVRNGGVVVPPIEGVPEPGTWLLMIAGFGLVGTALRRRPVAITA